MNSQAHVAYMMARAWQGKGTLARAINGYRDVLAVDPAHRDAALRLGHLLYDQSRMTEALDVYRQALRVHPHESELHKQFVNTLLLLEGMDAVYRHYQLTRIDSRVLTLSPGGPVVCTVVRNERARLPYFLDYYRRRGIRHFLAIDNASEDGTLEYLAQQDDVSLWRSSLSFHESNFGAAWLEPVLRLHASGHWCLIVDADELFYYPDCEKRSIPELCAGLDRAGALGMPAILLDMYSDLPVRDTAYEEERSFEEACTFFDRQVYHSQTERAGPFQNQTFYYGGVRQRIFGEAGGYILSKIPLIKYSAATILAGGQHWTNAPAERIALESGCLLHFKFFSTFTSYTADVASREKDSHWIGQHREYERALGREHDLTFYDPEHSVRLEDSRQLEALQIMRRDPALPRAEAPVFPKIDPVEGFRPFWSIILTVYRRTEFLEQALRSVLSQARSPEEMEIEVVSDGPADAVHGEIERLVRSIAGDRVTFHAYASRAGHPEIFNVCVRRARGQWVHILHDDDWVAPGFYEAMEEGIRQAPDAGAAFCRHHHVDKAGRLVRTSPLERESAGVLENWLERITFLSRLQTASVVVRRRTYERLGGFCPQARSAFDWEMWQRIAAHEAVFYDPRPLAYFRESDVSESARLSVRGTRFADTRAAIAVAQTYLPDASTFARRAGELYALLALDEAKARLNAGDAAGVLANMREAMLCSESSEARGKLLALLAKIKDFEI